MPKIMLKNNMISVKHLQCMLSNIFPGKGEKFALTGVSERFHYDENKKKTDVVEAIVYTVTEMSTLASFNVKVLSSVPVITAEELSESEERVFVSFPMDKTIVQPYKLEYGMATVSIIAPYVELDESTDSEENFLDERGDSV